MGQKQITGLILRAGVWHIDKSIKGFGRLCESTDTSSREEAETYLIHRLEGIRQQVKYGEAPQRTWREAATRYLVDYAHLKSIALAVTYLGQLDPYIGDLPISEVDDDALAEYKEDRLNLGRSNRTVNIALERVIRVQNLACRKWKDRITKQPWLDQVPMIEKLSEKGGRTGYPLSWDEQTYLFRELPDYLERMALYKVNTGCREQEVCKLSWDWEVRVPELRTSVFIIPSDFGGRSENAGVKNGEDRLVVLNRVAESIIEGQRGKHPHLVFPFEGEPLSRMNSTAWRNARERAAKVWLKENHSVEWGFRRLRVHDLKHTYGRRLRAADIDHETRQELLGHRNNNVTTQYSASDLERLIAASNKITATDTRAPSLTILKRRAA